MKKLFAMALAAAMTLSLAACGGKSEAPAASSKPAASTSVFIPSTATGAKGFSVAIRTFILPY